MGNVVITGANRGIGLELAKLNLARGHKVWAVCRSDSQELQESGAQVLDGVELADLAKLPEVLAPLCSIQIDLLINNAGILRDEQLNSINTNTIEEQYRINALVPLVITDLLKDNFNSGAKVGLLTSRMGSMADNSSGGRYGYRMSKAALNAAGVSLAQDLKSRDIAVAILHPGYVQTGMVGFRGDVSAELSASRLQQRLDELTMETTGTFWHANGEVLPW